jgi:hypothetical protein
MLIESLRKLCGDFTRVHAFNLPALQHVDRGAVLENGDCRRRWKYLGHQFPSPCGGLHVNSGKNRS